MSTREIKYSIDGKRVLINVPNETEIWSLKSACRNEGKDGEMIMVQHWDGPCWRTFFDSLKERSDASGADQWDVFAVMLTKIMGTKFVKKGDGSVTIVTKTLDPEC